MARRYEGRVAVIGVAGRDEVGPMRAFVERHGLGHVTHLVDDDGTLWERFGVPAQPAWVFVDARGAVVERVFGPLDEDAFAAHVEALGG